MNPPDGPKYIAHSTVTAVTGLNPGIGAKMSLPTTEIAVMTPTATSRLSEVGLFSIDIRHAMSESAATIMLKTA